MTAGVAGAFVGTPAEVSLIRMTADGRLPPAERRNYKNVFDSLFRIVKEEGVLTLWRGAVPTMGRAMVVNAAQLASYSQAKQFLLDTGQIQLF
jgi:solute carrier family 25 oxoglutarate transporter 11